MPEGAPGEFAGFGRSEMRLRRKNVEQCFDNGRSAMDVKLGHVLSRKGGRSRKPQPQAPVDKLALVGAYSAQLGPPGNRSGAGKFVDNMARSGTADPYDRHSGPALARRQ